jgi:hypothetical protein
LIGSSSLGVMVSEAVTTRGYNSFASREASVLLINEMIFRVSMSLCQQINRLHASLLFLLAVISPKLEPSTTSKLVTVIRFTPYL